MNGRFRSRAIQGLRPRSRPFVVCALLLCATSTALGQDPVRPWLDWKTVATRNYRFHFPRELEEWTRATAERVESIDSAIVSLVGYAPERPVHVVVDDPFNIANGYALPFIDRPVSVWWASPPDPRNDVGDYRTWGEMLATHELTHIAHLARPSRNPFQRQIWESLPANLGPIARKAPRWVYEGYATLIEGRITGTGRPNNVWRPALLRQWAIEGRLPTYGQLSGSADYQGGAFAYLGGSAFLEWLARREGDSSLVLVWRRMTARLVRSFDQSFAGVYGDAPAILYGRHVAELTRDAMAVKTELERAGLVEGTLVQHLSWDTGDPAISPGGDRVAIALRQRERPATVVVWSTGRETEDTAFLRKRIDAQKRDPIDVPDRRFYPVAKKVLKSLPALNGRSFSEPRWIDDRRILVTHWAPRPDGTLRPDLYIWDTAIGDLRRVTHGAGIAHADPLVGGSTAIAERCRGGHCDVVTVDLPTGRVAPVLRGSAVRSYYRPRVSRDRRHFAVSVAEAGRWRVLVAAMNGDSAQVVDPDDGANRYDAQWMGNDSLVVVSELGGIPNLELLHLSGGAPRTLTRVTGAAIAPDVNPADGSIWFLTMHALGLDVRRLASSSARADSTIAVIAERFGFAGVHRSEARIPVIGSVSATRAYGAGPRHQRWVPGAFFSGEGGGAFVSVFTGDIVGRLNANLTVASGQAGTVRGGSLRVAWRYPRPALEAGVHAFIHDPSQGRNAQPGTDSLAASVLQSVLSVSGQTQDEGWSLRGRVGAAAGVLEPTLGPSHVRRLEFAEAAVRLYQASGAMGAIERLRIHATQGRTRADFVRLVGSVELETTGRDAFPLELGVTVGRITGNPHPFDLFTVGGVASPVGDSSLLSQRFALPVFPTGVSTGKALAAWRAALPGRLWTLFYTGVSAAPDIDQIRLWQRAVGVETKYVLPVVPVAYAPRIESRGGVGYTLDAPFRHRVRVYLEMQVQP